MCACPVPGWPVLWLERWPQLWSPGLLDAAGGRAVGGKKPESFLTLWERRPGALGADKETRSTETLTKRLFVVLFTNHWIHARVLTCIMRGMACICIGVGEFSPAPLRFWRMRGLRRYSDCSSSNVHAGSGMSQPCTFMRCWERIRFT